MTFVTRDIRAYLMSLGKGVMGSTENFPKSGQTSVAFFHIFPGTLFMLSFSDVTCLSNLSFLSSDSAGISECG